ncbi:MAG: hypothetical protein LBB75_04675 [Oscillospiraceae bacterium]|jgi:hypothetical protein|nr:hypothetical protein [Oscillospiraceae bacterium]
MKRKRNFVWRAALVLLALTCASTSIYFTNAKYITTESFTAGFKIYSLIGGTGSISDAPAGRWAFYVRGQTGGACNSRAGGNPGIIKGVYDKSVSGSLTVGSTTRASNGGDWSGTGGNGGQAMYILDDLSAIPSSITGIVAVAAGGGGSSPNHNSGNAGANGGVDGGGTWAGYRAGDGSQTTSATGLNGGGGGTGSGGSGMSGQVILTSADDGQSGSWFWGGKSGNIGGYNAGGGGVGLYGGGGGGLGVSSGAGGGGSSYSAAGGKIADLAPASGSYEAYALAWYNEQVTTAGNNDLRAVLVWLGP